MHKLSSWELLTLDACALRSRIEAGLLTSAELVSKCLDQIQAHENSGAQLRAVVNTAPRDLLLTRARELDDERQNGHVRSNLHGIPILIKVRMLESIRPPLTPSGLHSDGSQI